MAAHRLRRTTLGALTALGLTAAAQAGYVETWNSDTARENGWWYYDAADTGHDGDVALAWLDVGGVPPAPSGQVHVDAGDATAWAPTGAGNYYLAYTYGATHAIDLTLDPQVWIALKDGGGLDLKGGTLRFWIGDYDDPDGAGGAPPILSFYSFDQALVYGDTDWVVNSIDVRTGDWLAINGLNAKPASALLSNPGQWGFGLFGAGDDPSGTLALDNFNVPAPAPLALVALGIAGLGMMRRAWSAGFLAD